MNISQYEFWLKLNTRIGEAQTNELGAIDMGAKDLATVNLQIGRRQAYAHVQQWAEEVWNEMNGINQPLPQQDEEPDNEIQL